MWASLSVVADNLGVGIPYLILIIGTLGSFIAMAKDFKFGLILLLVLSGTSFIILRQMGLNWIPALAEMMVALVLMAFSLYFVNKTGSGGVI